MKKGGFGLKSSKKVFPGLQSAGFARFFSCRVACMVVRVRSVPVVSRDRSFCPARLVFLSLSRANLRAHASAAASGKITLPWLSFYFVPCFDRILRSQKYDFSLSNLHSVVPHFLFFSNYFSVPLQTFIKTIKNQTKTP